VNTFQSNEQPHLVQRWLRHASPRARSIYGDVVGSKELVFAARMWRKSAKDQGASQKFVAIFKLGNNSQTWERSRRQGCAGFNRE
jgi:hypothetical protein